MKEVLEKIKELIKNFINPVQPEKSFDELAVAAGIREADLNVLKKSMGGVNWKFDEGEEPKKVRTTKVSQKENQVQQKQRVVGKEQNKGLERE